MDNRASNYNHLAGVLDRMSDAEICSLVDQAEPISRGLGGATAKITIDQIHIFVKKIALSDFELTAEHRMSTANIFGLPSFHQYGIGLIANFSAWRELTAHIETTRWVLSKQCVNFPLMYHWRIVPNNETERKIDANKAAPDRTDAAIKRRMDAINSASSQIVLFLEYVPKTLYQWLSEKLKGGDEAAAKALSMVEDNLETLFRFLNQEKFAHFDAHFKNIVTDGEGIYLGDFGLVLSAEFELDAEEKDFLDRHASYDKCVALANLVYTIIAASFGEEQWLETLGQYLNGQRPQLSPTSDLTIKKYAPLTALYMDRFYSSLKDNAATTAYPAAEIERLLAQFQYG